MGWKETIRNRWEDDEKKYAIILHCGGNWSMKVEDLKKKSIISNIYLAIKREEEARGYVDMLLFQNPNVDSLIDILKCSSRR